MTVGEGHEAEEGLWVHPGTWDPGLVIHLVGYLGQDAQLEVVSLVYQWERVKQYLGEVQRVAPQGWQELGVNQCGTWQQSTGSPEVRGQC